MSEEQRRDAVVVPHAPATADAMGRYLFYLHGGAVERGGPRAYSERFNASYDYAAIVKRFVEEGFVVISEARPKDTRVDAYANHVAEQVRLLISRGASPHRIAVVGHSKGGEIARRAAALLGNRDLRFVLLATCGFDHYEKSFVEQRGAQVRGHLLNIYDAEDDIAGSCVDLFERAGATDTHEVELRTGRGHALFFTPDEEWLAPLVAWLPFADARHPPEPESSPRRRRVLP